MGGGINLISEIMAIPGHDLSGFAARYVEADPVNAPACRSYGYVMRVVHFSDGCTHTFPGVGQV